MHASACAKTLPIDEISVWPNSCHSQKMSSVLEYLYQKYPPCCLTGDRTLLHVNSHQSSKRREGRERGRERQRGMFHSFPWVFMLIRLVATSLVRPRLGGYTRELKYWVLLHCINTKKKAMRRFLTIRLHGKTVTAICFMLLKPWEASATNWGRSILSINTKNTHLWCNSLTHHNILKYNHCIMPHTARFLNVALGGNSLWPPPHHIRDSALWSQ